MSAALVRPRSWLFIPGDSEKKLAKIDTTGADAVIIDLEDAVAPANKAAARTLTASVLADRPADGRGQEIWVRINPLDGALAQADIDAVLSSAPDGIVLPKSEGLGDLDRLGRMLDAAETACGIAPGSTRILPVATETPRAVLMLGEFAQGPVDRLAGLTWGAEDLGAAVGAIGNRLPDGRFYETFRVARGLMLMAAHAAQVQAIETLMADFRDDAGLRASSMLAYREGFTGRLAIHPAQVPIINAAFTPDSAQIDEAQAIIAAFADAGEGAGTVAIAGRMVDRPHLVQAQKIVARAKAYAERG